MAEDGLVTVTASEVAPEIARGAISAEDYACACLARIDAVEGEIKAFAHLEGVTDAWLQSLNVEKVAGGQIPPDQHQRLLAELAEQKAMIVTTCCAPASKVARK